MGTFLQLTVGMISEDKSKVERKWDIFVNVDDITYFAPIIEGLDTSLSVWKGCTNLVLNGSDRHFVLESPATIVALIGTITGMRVIMTSDHRS